jgi:DNA-binding response OmpR family regulator
VKILIVDDSHDVLDVLELLLAEKFEILKTPSAREVLQLIVKEKIDLLITDLNMPEMSGIELSMELRKGQVNLPIILFTALDKELAHTLPLTLIKDIHFVGDKDMNQLMDLVQNVSKRYTLPFGTKE